MKSIHMVFDPISLQMDQNHLSTRTTQHVRLMLHDYIIGAAERSIHSDPNAALVP